LYDLNLVYEWNIGTYKKFVEDIEKNSKYSFQEVVDVFTFYDYAVKNWYCYNSVKDRPKFYDDKWIKPQQPYIAPKTAGRNDPCPCGSGRKYKKCCLGKE